jgi:predicted secreted hydrolase
MRRQWTVSGVAALVALGAISVAAGVWHHAHRASGGVSASVTDVLSAGEADAGFARVTGPLPVRFPADAGPHPAHRTEWWYYTGNLAAGDGRRFGFQLTFFRSALAPPEAVPARASPWATAQVYLAHFAVTDVAAARFHSAERLARGSAGLAGARADPYRVWLESWSAAGNEQGRATGSARLRAADGSVAIDLAVTPRKAPALHGRRGYSVKGPQPGNASMYYSLARLGARGVITTADGTFDVDGLAWMDHEWSTSALDARTQVGWDWFSLQLDDDRELMLFQIRRTDGGISVESAGSLVARDGTVLPLARDDFRVESLGRWRSPRTGANYPSGWRVTVPRAGVALVVEPLLDDQELQTFIRYWEGAVRVNGTAGVNATPGADGRSGVRRVQGFGYVELTGYAPSAPSVPGR